MIDPAKIERFKSEDYRTSYMSGRVRTSIALQIRQLRETSSMSQADLADRIGTRQSAISRLENTEYGRASVQTLLDIANALDVALIVRFGSYDEFVSQHGNMAPNALSAETFSQTYERHAANIGGAEISSGLKLKITEKSTVNAPSSFVPNETSTKEGGISARSSSVFVSTGGREESWHDARWPRPLSTSRAEHSRGILATIEKGQAT